MEDEQCPEAMAVVGAVLVVLGEPFLDGGGVEIGGGGGEGVVG